jgi:hypothetical protein
MSAAKLTPDSMGWFRLQVKSERLTNGTLVTLDCGHTYEGAAHFDYSHDDGKRRTRCHECYAAIAKAEGRTE